MSMFNKVENLIKEYKIEKYFTKKYFDYFLLTIAFLIAVYVDWGLKQIVAGLAVLFVILNPIKSEVFAKAALYILAIVPIALIFGRDGKAEKLATAAYGMLVMTVVMAIWEMKKEKKAN